MKVRQLAILKQWHVLHRSEQPIEHRAWDAMITLWLVGWLVVPAGLLMSRPGSALVGALLLLAPGSYVAVRRRLHLQGRLRCDWLEALPRH